MNQIRFTEEKNNKNVNTKYFRGYNCTLKVQKLKFDNDDIVLTLEHENVPYAPEVVISDINEKFLFDFSLIQITIEQFDELEKILNDFRLFCEEFERRRMELLK